MIIIIIDGSDHTGIRESSQMMMIKFALQEQWQEQDVLDEAQC